MTLMNRDVTWGITLLLGLMTLPPISLARDMVDQQCAVCHMQPDVAPEAFDHSSVSQQKCTDCHKETMEGKYLHTAIKQEGCVVCHDPENSTNPKMLREASIGDNCAECHEDVTDELEFHHGPVAVGACTSCHNPHSSDHATLLKETGPKLCAQCHDDIFNNLETLKSTHQPVREDCLGCHQPHGGDRQMMLTSALPDLCLDCHDDMADAIDDATFSHAPVTEGRACLSCHNPHASGRNHLLIADGAQLCLSCHNRKIKSKQGFIADIAHRLAKYPERHGPVADDDCVTCHQPHGGDFFKLLTAAYPAKRYVSFDEDAYALCFECHEVEAFEDAVTDDATEFRDGQRNLHFLHVGSGDKGRTCRFCHDPHASSNSHQVTDSVAFGAWRIPLNYEATPTGGSCGPGCHQPRRYDRLTPANPRRIVPTNTAQP